MTNSNGSSSDDIRQLLAELARRQLETQTQLNNLAYEQTVTQRQLDELTENTNRILARNAILDDVLLELRDSHETMKQNFNENQRTTNAALQSLEAILLQLTRRFDQ